MRIFELDLFKGSMNDLLDDVFTLGSPQPRVVVTPNVDHLQRIQGDPDLRLIYKAADVFLIDGVPLLLLARLFGGKAYRKLSGADLFPEVLRRARRHEARIGILGGTDAKEVRKAIDARFPGLRIEVCSPPMGFVPDGGDARAIAEYFRDRQVDLIFVCLGMPKQEIWAQEFRDMAGARWFFCVGGALDFVTGAQLRAPSWVSLVGMEWFWRLATSPRRLWKRYATGLVWIGPAFGREVLRKLVGRGS